MAARIQHTPAWQTPPHKTALANSPLCVVPTYKLTACPRQTLSHPLTCHQKVCARQHQGEEDEEQIEGQIKCAGADDHGQAGQHQSV